MMPLNFPIYIYITFLYYTPRSFPPSSFRLPTKPSSTKGVYRDDFQYRESRYHFACSPFSTGNPLSGIQGLRECASLMLSCEGWMFSLILTALHGDSSISSNNDPLSPLRTCRKRGNIPGRTLQGLFGPAPPPPPPLPLHRPGLHSLAPTRTPR